MSFASVIGACETSVKTDSSELEEGGGVGSNSNEDKSFSGEDTLLSGVGVSLDTSDSLSEEDIIPGIIETLDIFGCGLVISDSTFFLVFGIAESSVDISESDLTKTFGA